MEKVVNIFLLFLALISCAFCAIVRVENGEIRGTEMTTRKGFSFDAFLKIPFAEAPVPDSTLGNLRFQPPIKKAPWTGILNATAYGPMCMQIIIRNETAPMHEDCLHLNVFTKNINGTSLKPVIVFIHGGAFEYGSSRNHGPEYMLDRDVVLVTINYRVGAFGFLAAGTEKAMGNMGLKDQVMALEWIRDNIENFGGDPNQVTISGLSAGGFSVTLHAVSEMSKNLFKRVIVMSGAITWMSRMNTNYRNLAEELAKGANCTESDIVSCLQEVPPEFLVEFDIKSNHLCPDGLIWNPVIEEDFNQTKFLSKLPLEIFQENPQEKFKDIQFIIGITEHEAIYLTPSVLSRPRFVSFIEEETAQFMYDCFYLEKVPKDVTRFKHLYLAYDEIDERSFNGIADFTSDGVIGYGSHRLVHLLSNFTDVFYYKFNYQGINSVFDHPRESPYGVSHADDIQYVFDTWYVGPSINESHRDNFMVERMTRIWENFAYFGDPNNNTDASTAEHLDGMIWPKHDWIDEYYLEIGVHMVEKRGLNLPRYAAWDELNSESTASNVHNLILMTFISLALKHFM